MSHVKCLLVFCCLSLGILTCNSPSGLSDWEASPAYIYVYQKKDKPLTIDKGKLETNYSTLNRILRKHKVDRFFSSWPNAEAPALQNIYEMHFAGFQGNIEALERDLAASNLFEKVEVARYYQAEGKIVNRPGITSDPSTISSCPTPEPPVNDIYTANGWTNNYALTLMEAECAWTITKGDPSIVVGIADTEFDEDHEDLVNQFATVWGTVPPECDHGSLVAGCVSPETNNGLGIAGVGYNTKIAGYRVPHNYVPSYGCTGNPWPGVWQAYQEGRQIINVSWTGVGSATPSAPQPGGVVMAVQEMVDNGTILVLGAGNSPTSTSHSSYANIPGVINVSGVDANNEHAGTNHAHNQWVDLCALSINVSTTSASGNYVGGWGTSFAAPQVAGVAALILAVNPCLTPAEVEDVLKSTTDPINDSSSFLGGLGTGRLNAYKAVRKAATLCVEYQNITTDSEYESYILCTRDIELSNNAELKLNAIKELQIFDSFIVNAGTTLKINVDGNYQLDCN